MDWKSTARDHADRASRTVYESPVGIGIEFEDGCDAFWILPGEPMSTTAVPVESPDDIDDLLSTYNRLDLLRTQVICVLEHHCARSNCRLSRERTGAWTYDCGVSGEMNVGAPLTQAALTHKDVPSILDACEYFRYFSKKPTWQQIEEYLAACKSAAPAVAADGLEYGTNEASSMAAALICLDVCKPISTIDKINTTLDLQNSLRPRGDVGKTLMGLAERLPHVDVYVEMLGPGVLNIEYSDRQHHFEVDTRSRSLARQIRQDGPESVANALADEYRVRDAERARVLSAIWHAAALRGWRRETFVADLVKGGTRVYLGQTHREICFETGQELSDRVHGVTADVALREMFAENMDFAEASIAALDQADPPPDMEEVHLSPRTAPPSIALCELTPEIIAEMSALSDERLQRWFDRRESLWHYRDVDYHDPSIDHWADTAQWLRLAEKHHHSDPPDPFAVIVLLDAGDPRGDARARAYLQNAELHDEVSEADIEIVWRYRHDYRDVARKWFGPEAKLHYADDRFDGVRARLGDPTAARRMGFKSLNLDYHVDPHTICAMPAEQRERLRADLRDWARTEHRCSPPSPERLRLAADMGWRDVGESLECNPLLLPGLLTTAPRDDELCEPGLLVGGEVLLSWSRLIPGAFLARVLATAEQTDLVALAEEGARSSAQGKTRIRQGLGMASSVYRSWQKALDPIMAIAWKRCLPYLAR